MDELDSFSFLFSSLSLLLFFLLSCFLSLLRLLLPRSLLLLCLEPLRDLDLFLGEGLFDFLLFLRRLGDLERLRFLGEELLSLSLRFDFAGEGDLFFELDLALSPSVIALLSPLTGEPSLSLTSFGGRDPSLSRAGGDSERLFFFSFALSLSLRSRERRGLRDRDLRLDSDLLL